MDDFERHLSTLLQERAAIARVDDRLEDIGSVPARRLPGPRRGWWLAAAAVVALVAGAVWAVARDDDRQRLQPADPTVSTPDSGDWTELPAPPFTNHYQAVSVATDKGWFVWPRSADAPTPNAGAYFDTSLQQWVTVPAPDLPDSRGRINSAAWTGIEVVATFSDSDPQVMALDPASMTWREIPISDEARAAWPTVGAFAADFDERIVLWGPDEAQGVSLLLLDPADGEWQVIPKSPNGDELMGGPWQSCGVISAGRWVVIASLGHNDPGNCAAAQLQGYDTTDGTWHVWSAPESWVAGFATWIGDRLLFAGLESCGSLRGHAATFDPVTASWATATDTPTAEASCSLTSPRVGCRTTMARR